MKWMSILAGLGLLLGLLPRAWADETSFDPKKALAQSQAAIGRPLSDLTFTDTAGKPVRLSSFRGHPLVISLVYTSCFAVCPMITQHLARVVEKGRSAFGEQEFQILTIGFDTQNDTPERMGAFARQLGVKDAGWRFLSANEATVAILMRETGFTYQPAAQGFDHLVQATVVDQEGRIYRQVYGEVFDPPLLIEPMRELILGRSRPNEPLADEVWRRVRFFCTTYDARNGMYRFDYSFFWGLAMGFTVFLLSGWFLIKEYRYARHHRRSPP